MGRDVRPNPIDDGADTGRAVDAERVSRLVGRAGLPTRLPARLKPEDFQRLMAHDKKVLAGKLRLVLLRAIGEALVTDTFDASKLEETVAHYCAPPHAA